MLCLHCKKNQAVISYGHGKKSASREDGYCMECYNRLFVGEDGAEGDDTALSACPYCGVTKQEFLSTKMVGCAHCYRMLKDVIEPQIVKMQGAKLHKGKRPSTEDEAGDALDGAARARAVKRAKFQRQKRELEMLVAKLKKDGDESGAKNYAEKLARMEKKATIEEDFVWRDSLQETK